MHAPAPPLKLARVISRLKCWVTDFDHLTHFQQDLDCMLFLSFREIAPGRILTDRIRESSLRQKLADGKSEQEGLVELAAEVPLKRIGQLEELGALVASWPLDAPATSTVRPSKWVADWETGSSEPLKRRHEQHGSSALSPARRRPQWSDIRTGTAFSVDVGDRARYFQPGATARYQDKNTPLSKLLRISERLPEELTVK
ncbi:hypothetical protein [Paraburkholderia sp. BL10I2N1]|uniref:hypothetical protein n=1 Tax=Paraburkholderia sp. BL10I2N1 TaxID=1938796 RepID=UPI001414FC6E|nr:hypothetical protein [Paraburkholderia sp. BL10I2N1]